MIKMPPPNCPDCGGSLGETKHFTQVCLYCEWHTYRRARKNRRQEPLNQTVYRNLWHAWRRAKKFPQDRSSVVSYMNLIRDRKPDIFAGFIHGLRTNR